MGTANVLSNMSLVFFTNEGSFFFLFFFIVLAVFYTS